MNLDLVSIRMVREKTLKGVVDKITNSSDAANFFKLLLQDLDREVMLLLTLDHKKAPINVSVISMGTVNSTLVHPREVFKTAVLSNASGIILAHNHPSGNVEPSEQDLQVTQRIQEVGALLGIELIDHIVIGDDNYYSLRENNLFPFNSKQMRHAEMVSDPTMQELDKKFRRILEKNRDEKLKEKENKDVVR